MGAEDDPEDGGAVAAAVFGAVGIYGVSFPPPTSLGSGRSGWLIFCCAAALSLVLWYAGSFTSEGAEKGSHCAFMNG